MDIVLMVVVMVNSNFGHNNSVIKHAQQVCDSVVTQQPFLNTDIRTMDMMSDCHTTALPGHRH